MPKTVNTSLTSYAPAAEILKRGDWRVFADLCSDTGARLATSAVVLTDPNFLALLLDASGELEAACLVSQRYQPVDLAALTGVAQARLYRLLYRLMVLLAYERRPDRQLEQPWLQEKVEQDLQALREGQRIFSFTETQDAGLLHHDTETAAVVERRDGVVVQAEDFFGVQARRLNG
jgi:hypothetical protein